MLRSGSVFTLKAGAIGRSQTIWNLMQLGGELGFCPEAIGSYGMVLSRGTK